MSSNLIYILTNGENYKIGITTDTTEKRLAQLNTGSDKKITEVFSKLVGINAPALESMLHETFRETRLNGG